MSKGIYLAVIITLLLLPSLLPCQVLAYTQLYRFQYCSSIQDEADRLDCYDNYARELGLNPGEGVGGVSASQSTSGFWTIRGESTRDTATVFVFTEGSSTIGRASLLVIPTLVARCSNRTTELFISFGAYFPVQVGPQEKSSLYSKQSKSGRGELDRGTATTVTFDGREPMELQMNRSQDGKSYFFPNPVSFIRQLRTQKTMAFRLKSPDHAPLETSFKLVGIEKALEPLRKQCEW